MCIEARGPITSSRFKIHQACVHQGKTGVKEDLAIMLHMYGRKASCRVWCSELMAVPCWVKSSYTLLYLGNEGVYQSGDTCDPAMLPNQYYFLTAIWVRASQVHAEILSKTRNFSWLLTAHVWGHKCGVSAHQRQGPFSPPEDITTTAKCGKAFH